MLDLKEVWLLWVNYYPDYPYPGGEKLFAFKSAEKAGEFIDSIRPQDHVKGWRINLQKLEDA